MSDNNKHLASAHVGIFWGVPDGSGLALVTDATPLASAEPYGDFLTHPSGHADVWDGWRRLGPTSLARRGLPAAIAFHEYEECPRGRIVYDTAADVFIVYADVKLQTPPIMAQIIRAFGLAERRSVVRSDSHYRS